MRNDDAAVKQDISKCITLLTEVDGKLMTKRHVHAADGTYEREVGYDKGYRFTSEQVKLESLDDIEALLTRIQPTQAVIRACPKAGISRIHLRRLIDTPTEKATYRAENRTLLHWDFDKAPAPWFAELLPFAPIPDNMMADYIKFVMLMLPEPCRSAGAIIQFSSSAGIESKGGWGVVKAHVLQLLDTAIISDETLSAIAGEVGADTSMMRSVQCNFLAAPIFDGADDFIKKRWVRVDGPDVNAEELAKIAPLKVEKTKSTRGNGRFKVKEERRELAAGCLTLACKKLHDATDRHPALIACCADLAGLVNGGYLTEGECYDAMRAECEHLGIADRGDLEAFWPCSLDHQPPKHPNKPAAAKGKPENIQKALDALSASDDTMRRQVGRALKALGQERSVWDDWCMVRPDYNPDEQRTDWDGFDGGTARDLANLVKRAGGWLGRLRRAPAVAGVGAVLPCHDNIITILMNDPRWAGVIGWDVFADRKAFVTGFDWGGELTPQSPGYWTDADTTKVLCWLGREYQVTCYDKMVLAAVDVVCKENKFHPVRNYLRSLTWDGVPRLAEMASTYFGATENHELLTMRLWMLSAAVRALREAPVKADCMLVLEGDQGLRKSTSLSVLGGQWYCSSELDLKSKDAMISMRGKWIVEVQELDKFSKTKAGLIKSFLSSPVDSYRSVYGKEAEDHQRCGVLAGTLNPGSDYLRDCTGARRFWPVRCSKADSRALEDDRDQLWAEAVHDIDAGARWWIDESSEEAAVLREAVDNRREEMSHEGVIQEYIGNHIKDKVVYLDDLVDNIVPTSYVSVHDRLQLKTQAGKLLALAGRVAIRRRDKNGVRKVGWEKTKPDARTDTTGGCSIDDIAWL